MVEDGAFSSNYLEESKSRRFWRTGGFYLLVELHREGSAPAACAAGLFLKDYINLSVSLKISNHQSGSPTAWERSHPGQPCALLP